MLMTCSTSSLATVGNTRSTRPSLLLSRPVITFTLSLRRISTRLCSVLTVLISTSQFLILFSVLGTRYSVLNHFRRQRNDLQKLSLTQLAGHRTKNARPHRLARVINQHRGILVEADVGAVAPPMLLARAHDHRLHHFAFLHLSIGSGFFYSRGDNVAQAGIQPGGPAERQNHLQLAGAGIVGDLQHASHHHSHGFNLPRSFPMRYLLSCSSTISGTSVVLRTMSFSFQRFNFESGRVSSIRTTSPTCASFFSSCA